MLSESLHVGRLHGIKHAQLPVTGLHIQNKSPAYMLMHKGLLPSGQQPACSKLKRTASATPETRQLLAECRLQGRGILVLGQISTGHGSRQLLDLSHGSLP